MIQKIAIGLLNAAPYNPRIELQPGMPEYEKLKRSIEEFGNVEPIIWNKRSGNVVGGHQRLKVLLEKGEKEVECVIVELDDKEEKTLNIVLNKIKGRWNVDKLADLLQELDETEAMKITGFEDWELQSLLMQYDHIKDLMEDDFSGYSNNSEHTTFTMTFSLPEDTRKIVENYLKKAENAKIKLATAIINKVKEGYNAD